MNQSTSSNKFQPETFNQVLSDVKNTVSNITNYCDKSKEYCTQITGKLSQYSAAEVIPSDPKNIIGELIQ